MRRRTETVEASGVRESAEIGRTLLEHLPAGQRVRREMESPGCVTAEVVGEVVGARGLPCRQLQPNKPSRNESPYL